MSFFKSNKIDFFKGIYFLFILLLFDIGFIYTLIVSWEENGNPQFISFILLFNIFFIGFNLRTIRLLRKLYQDVRKHGIKAGRDFMVFYKNKHKPKGILRIIRIFIGVTIILWSLQADGGIIFKSVLILFGIYNLWRVI